MLKKGFTTPVWWMIILGVVASAASIQTLHVWAGHDVEISALRRLSLFYLPLIMFVEAVMYWTIRKRIIYRRDAWCHIIVFTSAYVLSFLARFVMAAILVMHMPASRQIRAISYVQIYFFWALILTAHIFFARVLIKAFAKQPAEQVENGNLLDDVLD
jgi:hypothetical protein